MPGGRAKRRDDPILNLRGLARSSTEPSTRSAPVSN